MNEEMKKGKKKKSFQDIMSTNKGKNDIYINISI